MDIRSVLRKDQRKKLHEIEDAFEDADNVLLTGELGVGKSILGMAFALSHTPALYVCSSYPAVEELSKDSSKLFGSAMNSLIIVKPEGKERACRIPGCRHVNVWNPRKISGVIGKENVPSGYCPYASLYELSNSRADVVVTHHSLLRAGRLISRPNETLIIDECDEFLKSHDYLLLRFSGYKSTHLGIEVDNMSKVIQALQFLDSNPPFKEEVRQTSFRKKAQKSLGLVQEMYNRLANIAELEAERVAEVLSSSRLIKEQALRGIQSADEEIQLEVARIDGPQAKKQFRKRLNEFEPAEFRGLPRDLKQNLIDFWSVGHQLSRFYYRSRFPSRPTSKGYREVKMGDEIGDITFGFREALLISATPPPTLPRSTVIVEMGDLGNAKKMMFLWPKKGIVVRQLIEALVSDYNILGITTGKERVHKWIGLVGGTSVEEVNDIEELRKRLRAGKGNLIWNYYHSVFSKAVNYFHVFDGALVTEWIGRDIAPIEEDLAVQKRSALNNVVQMLGRVLRPDTGQVFRSRFSVILDRELYELFQDRYEESVFATLGSVTEAVNLIRKFAEPMPIQRRFRFSRDLNLLTQSAGRNPKTGRSYTQNYLKVSVPPDFPRGKYRVIVERLE